jgi:transcriptional regulator with XRE-family HTH domain
MPKTNPDRDFRQAFGARLKELRGAKGWTQKELAAKLETHVQQLIRYEGGLNIPPAESLVILAELLDTTTDFLLTGNNTDQKPLHSLRLLERFRALQGFTTQSQETVINVIDALIVKERAEAAVQPVTSRRTDSLPRSRSKRAGQLKSAEVEP